MSANASRSSQAFSTAFIPDDERVRAWENHNAETLIALRCDARAAGHFQAQEDNLELGGVHLARVRGTAHVVRRSAELIEQRPTSSLAIYVSLRGDALFQQAGRRQVIHPGDLLVCDADGQFVRGFGQGLDELAIRVDRSVLPDEAYSAALGGPLIVRRSQNNPYGRAIARLVGGSLGRPTITAPDEQTLIDLLSALAAQDMARPQLVHRALACAYAEERLRDPRLSAPEIATAVGISVRQLTRVFAAVGTTLPRHILKRRLDLAYALLTGPDAGTLVTATVAKMCGIHSVSHFSQDFRSRFGVSPGELRRSAVLDDRPLGERSRSRAVVASTTPSR
ncbi:helix-turn-helix domain-containing protein [Cryptosporangium sp. NPDC051539]|uniref:helix-turn-helix domain-containing protein n=1 Tax=Cryptosporangium sp. NPDC051539 TaxID=3363962 RepID=UPI00378DD1A2